jgi:SAM-dependent methyltransferase
MNLSTQYQEQEKWRSWDAALSRLPLRSGQRVLDLGCGVGQMTARLASLGAQAIGVDLNEELLATARSLHPSLSFERHDIGNIEPHLFGQVDGIWASFVAAYFCDLPRILSRWGQCLAPGGWMALVEVDDLLGHAPMQPSLRDEVLRFYQQSKPGGYQFECGRSLAEDAQRAGLHVIYQGTLPDQELSFHGPASEEVLAAWHLRVRRMIGLQTFFGERALVLEKALLGAMSSPEHHSTARVFFVIAQRAA